MRGRNWISPSNIDILEANAKQVDSPSSEAPVPVRLCLDAVVKFLQQSSSAVETALADSFFDLEQFAR